MKTEKYVDKSGKVWKRIKFEDRYRTEIIVPELEFEKKLWNYGMK